MILVFGWEYKQRLWYIKGPGDFLCHQNLFLSDSIAKLRLTIFIQQKLCKRFFSFVKSYWCLVRTGRISFLFCLPSIYSLLGMDDACLFFFFLNKNISFELSLLNYGCGWLDRWAGNGVLDVKSEKVNRERSINFRTMCRMKAGSFLPPTEELMPNASFSVIINWYQDWVRDNRSHT